MKKLGFIEIAALYVGIIMGAGFASGRECWQFFGVFGKTGYLGAIAVTIGFVLYAIMLTYIARKKNTAELGRLISPFENPLLDKVFGGILAFTYYFDYIIMTAAGGSILNQQFGVSKVVGGTLIAILCVATVLGNFEKISQVFKRLVPVLFAFAVLMIILVVTSDFDKACNVTFEPGQMSPNWVISAVVYLAYNTLAMITMAGNSSLNAKNGKTAFVGAILGALCLGCLLISLMSALCTDMEFSAGLDLPMLGYSMRISPVLNLVYGIILFGSIYSTGASTLFGFSTILDDDNNKPVIIVGLGAFGVVLGMSGFQNLVEFVYPVQGYIGVVFLILIAINFVRNLET